MKEIAQRWRWHACMPAHALACALILATLLTRTSMNQTSPTLAALQGGPSATGRATRVAVVSASWHRDIVQQANTAIRARMRSDPEGAPRAGVELDEFEVPGAFEIPLHAQRLARSGRYDAIIACGLVVNGGIYRHEFVAAAVIDGLMRVQLDTGTPVFTAVLTPRDFHAHEEHHAFFAAHFVKKGAEVASACLQTLASLRALCFS
jgi:6,7-dimethyl-8-ribityllumazine synthase